MGVECSCAAFFFGQKCTYEPICIQREERKL